MEKNLTENNEMLKINISDKGVEIKQYLEGIYEGHLQTISLDMAKKLSKYLNANL
jgi:protoporphyrinogen oxidase